IRILGIDAVEVYGDGGVYGKIGLDLADVKYGADGQPAVDQNGNPAGRVGRNQPGGDNKVYLDEIQYNIDNYGFPCALTLGGEIGAFLGIGARALCLFGACLIDVYTRAEFPI